MNRFVVVLTLAAAIVGTAKPSTLGAVVLDKEMDKAAEEIKKRLDLRPAGQRTVALTSFTCATDMRATGGALLAKKLLDGLVKHKAELATRPAVSISGEYRDVIAADGSVVDKAIIQLTLKDRDGKPIGAPIVSTVAGLESLTLLFPGLVPPGKIGIKLDPKMVVSKSRVLSNKAGKYAVEVLAADEPSVLTVPEDYKLLPPRVEHGLARVDIKREQAYALRVHNNSGEDAAVEVMIDGVSMFEFSDENQMMQNADKPKVRFVFVGKGKSALIRGWYLNVETTDLFYMTDRDKSAGYHKHTMRDLGTITVRFHVCWEKEKGAVVPRGEPSVAQRDLGTGFGMFQVPDLKRRKPISVGVIRETIPVQYLRP